MGKVKTGALIVLQREVALGEYERTGIPIDAKVSSQLLIDVYKRQIEMDLPEELEIAKVQYPCLLSVDKDIFQPRLPSYVRCV